MKFVMAKNVFINSIHSGLSFAFFTAEVGTAVTINIIHFGLYFKRQWYLLRVKMAIYTI